MKHKKIKNIPFIRVKQSSVSEKERNPVGIQSLQRIIKQWQQLLLILQINVRLLVGKFQLLSLP